jgi:hypothetical protein
VITRWPSSTSTFFLGRRAAAQPTPQQGGIALHEIAGDERRGREEDDQVDPGLPVASSAGRNE